MSVATTWGTSAEERALSFPCDSLVEQPHAELFRGITVRATPAAVFRWLCQLRVAPYSYDLLDNCGRRSPRELIEGLELLEAGQRFMDVFSLVDFKSDRHLTLRLGFDTRQGRVFGLFVSGIVVSYLVVPMDDGCRLLAKFVVRYRRGPLGLLSRLALPWGDLIMARKQLMTFRDLAEQA